MFYRTNIETHKNFLHSYMQQKNKANVTEKPTLFNEEHDIVNDEEIKKYEAKMTELHFRYILSPGSQDVPLKPLVRSFIKQLEKATGYNFSWMAVEHHDTLNEHSHILINGLDKNGKEVRFDKSIIKNTARDIASNICTSLVGLQTEEQIRTARARLPQSYRYTALDKDIEEYENHFDECKTIDGKDTEGFIIPQDDTMQKRLATLIEMGLATKSKTDKKYYLEWRWASKLKTIGRYNAFLKARNALRYSSASNLTQYEKETGLINGVVTQRFVQDDDESWNNAIVIENKLSGKAWFLPLRIPTDKSILGSVVECNIEKAQNGLMRPKIRIIGKGNNKQNQKNRDN